MAETAASSQDAQPEETEKISGWDRTEGFLPSTILRLGTWDQQKPSDILIRMTDSISSRIKKSFPLIRISGGKKDLELEGKKLSQKQIANIPALLADECEKIPRVLELNAEVFNTTYKTTMGLCRVEATLREFFVGNKQHRPVDLGPAFEMVPTSPEQQLMEKIAKRRCFLMQKRHKKETGEDRPIETFVAPFDIPKLFDTTQHSFHKLNKQVLELVGLNSEWSTVPTISALLSLYFILFNRNIKMPQRAEGHAKETPKILFDDRMKAFFGKVNAEGDGKKAAGPLFSAKEMTEGISYLLVIQRLTSRFTKKLKNARTQEEQDAFLLVDSDPAAMRNVHDCARLAVETKRYYKEENETRNRSKPKRQP